MHLARIALVSAALATPSLAQLAPPTGPITETDRVREEADARVPISAGFTTITESGSYYLTRNISSIVVAAIVVDAPDVTIDLNGYAITGGIGGIRVNADRVTIRNGKIRDVQGPAIAGRTAEHLVVEDVTIKNCGRGTVLVPRTDAAIELRNGRVERVRITDCPTGVGFFSDDATVKDTVIQDIDNSGIVFRGAANFSVFVEGCTLRDIGNIGIDATDYAHIRNTTIESTGGVGVDVQRDGLIQNVTVIDAGGTAISAGENSRVFGCSAIDAAANGVSVGRGGLIKDTTVGGASNTAFAVGPGGLIHDSTANGLDGSGFIVTGVGIALNEGATARGNAVTQFTVAGISMQADAIADSNTIVGDGESANLSENGFLALGNFVQITRNNVTFAGSASATLGSETSWIRTDEVDIQGRSRIGPANDLESPWANFVD